MMDEIIEKFIDDPESLSDEELERLLSALRSDPGLADELKDQLVSDQLVSGTLNVFKQHFADQVMQRIHDQTAEDDFSGRVLSRITEHRTPRKQRLTTRHRRSSSSAWRVWLSVAACIAIVFSVYYFNQWQAGKTQNLVIAKLITAVSGVSIQRGSTILPAQEAMDLIADDTVQTGKHGRATIIYSDKTVIDLQSDTKLKLWQKKQAKRMYIFSGEIKCDIKTQTAGNLMIFKTANAEAVVKGTQLTLLVKPDSTRLDVMAGQVHFTHTLDNKSIDVTAGHYAVAQKGVEFVPRSLSQETEQTEEVKEPEKKDEEAIPDIEEGVLFKEDFENTQLGSLPAGFKKQGGGTWAVREIDGNRVLEGNSSRLVFGAFHWDNYEVNLRIMFDRAPETVAIVVRYTLAGKNYQLELRPEGAYLVRSLGHSKDDPNELKGHTIRPAPGVWHSVKVICKGNEIEFWVDGILAIRSHETLTDKGKCKFYISKGKVFFDDIEIRKK